MKKVDASKVRIPLNYLLIKPDENYVTAQIEGCETGIIIPDFTYDKKPSGELTKISVKERNYSVYGTVYAIPEKIGFNRSEIKKFNSKYVVATKIDGQPVVINRSVMNEIGQLTEFSYLAHKSASDKNIVVETDFGDMYLIKYDLLTMVVNDDLSPKKMLNGYIMVEPEEDESIKKEDGMMYKTSPNGLIIPVLKHNLKRSRKKQIGTARFVGDKIGGYLQQENLCDPDIDVKPGDRLMYDPRGASRHEHHYHQIYSNKPMQLIQRRDILLSEKEVNFDKLSF
jgi:hypothetical protein